MSQANGYNSKISDNHYVGVWPLIRSSEIWWEIWTAYNDKEWLEESREDIMDEREINIIRNDADEC